VSVLVENRRQARKVRIVTWASALWCIGWLYWATDLSQTYGLSPGDGGVLRPPLQRWAAAAIVALIGILPFAGMAIYARLYVVRLERERADLRVTVIGFFTPATRTHPVTDVGGSRKHRGELRLRTSVNAPWMVLRIAGRPYIIDLQAERVDSRAIERLVADAAKARGAS
jgi:hypothetical protein